MTGLVQLRRSSSGTPLTGSEGELPEVPTGAPLIYVETMGCQMNEYDSSRMRDLLEESHDLVPTEAPEEAAA